MATIKSCTDISQSRKLAEILPLESADYHYIAQGEKSYFYPYSLSSDAVKDYDEEIKYIPCWSLAALLNILNSIDGWYPGIDAQVNEDNLWQICMFSYETGSDISTAAINKELVDTCYEVILKLKEKGLL